MQYCSLQHQTLLSQPGVSTSEPHLCFDPTSSFFLKIFPHSFPVAYWILEQSLEGLMLKLKLQYFGHLIWRANSLGKTLMLGKIEGRRRRGQQRMRWLDGIADSVDMILSKLWEILTNRDTWRAAVQEVTKSWTWLSNWTTTTEEKWTYSISGTLKRPEPSQCCGSLTNSTHCKHTHTLCYACVHVFTTLFSDPQEFDFHFKIFILFFLSHSLIHY